MRRGLILLTCAWALWVQYHLNPGGPQGWTQWGWHDSQAKCYDASLLAQRRIVVGIDAEGKEVFEDPQQRSVEITCLPQGVKPWE